MVFRREKQATLSAVSGTQPSLYEPWMRLGRGLGVALAIAFFWSGGFCLAWLVVPWLAVVERSPRRRQQRLQRLVAGSFRWFLRLLERATLYRCRYEGHFPEPESAIVYVANHPSLLDVTAIIGRLPHVSCVVKRSLVDSPLVGRLLRACGHISAGDGGLMSGALVIDALLARLSEGRPVLVFPEGTRSPERSLHPFRRGAFEAAQRGAVPLVPLFLSCEPPALGKGTPLTRHPLRCPTLTVRAEPAIDMSHHDPKAACRRIESEFRARLGATSGQGEP